MWTWARRVADEIPGILDRFAHPVGVMHVPDRFDIRRIHLAQYARYLLPAAEGVVGFQADGDAVPLGVGRRFRQACRRPDR